MDGRRANAEAPDPRFDVPRGSDVAVAHDHLLACNRGLHGNASEAMSGAKSIRSRTSDGEPAKDIQTSDIEVWRREPAIKLELASTGVRPKQALRALQEPKAILNCYYRNAWSDFQLHFLVAQRIL